MYSEDWAGYVDALAVLRLHWTELSLEFWNNQNTFVNAVLEKIGVSFSFGTFQKIGIKIKWVK